MLAMIFAQDLTYPQAIAYAAGMGAVAYVTNGVIAFLTFLART